MPGDSSHTGKSACHDPQHQVASTITASVSGVARTVVAQVEGVGF